MGPSTWEPVPWGEAPVSYLGAPAVLKRRFRRFVLNQAEAALIGGVEVKPNMHTSSFIFSPAVCNLDAGRHAR